MSAKASALNGLAQLLSSGQYSDLKLVSQGEEFKVHKMIVCLHSPVIAAALNGPFQEATTNIININEFDARTLHRMIKFMYGEDYDELGIEAAGNITQSTESPPQATTIPGSRRSKPLRRVGYGNVSHAPPTPPKSTEMVLNHMKVNAIADYYNVLPLKELANTKIKKILEREWSRITFPLIVNSVFALNNDPSLHEIVSLAAGTHIEELISHDDFINVKAPNDFAMGILKDVIPVYVLKEKEYKKKLSEIEERCQSLGRKLDTEVEHRIRETQRANREKNHADKEADALASLNKNINDCLNWLGKNKTCPNYGCNAPLSHNIVRDGGTIFESPKYVVRDSSCARCGRNGVRLDNGVVVPGRRGPTTGGFLRSLTQRTT